MTHEEKIVTDLKKLRAKIVRQRREVNKTREALHQDIRQALAAGVPVRRLQSLTHYSAGRIYQIRDEESDAH